MKRVAQVFLLALLGYIVVYAAIEYRRTRRGPWQVSFTRSATGDPALIINQPKLGITNAKISFLETGFSAPANGPTLHLRQPQPVPYDVPFGKCIFMDTTFLPGTVTFQFFGHEIELLPRVLIINHTEHPWQPPPMMSLPPPKPALQGGRV